MALLLNANDSVSRSYSITKPRPLHPIIPSGCGERTENVMPSAPAETKTNNGITITCDGNGVYTLSGTALTSVNVAFKFKDFTIPISVGQGGQGTMSLFNTVPSGQIDMVLLNGNTLIDAWHINSANRKSNSYVTMSGAVCNVILFYVSAGDNCDCVIKPCFTNDSIYPTSYIPYGYKLPLTSAGQDVDIYLGEVQTTRRIKKLVLTGEEKFSKNTASSSNYLYYIPRNALLPNSIGKTPLICNELPVINETPVSQIGISSNNNFSVIYVNFGADVMNAQPSGNTDAGLKEYLAAQYAAGTPVTVWYALAEPEAGIVNEPLMKIGDYVDSITSSQAGAQIPTSAGETTISWGGEELAPSEFDSIQEWVDIPTYTYTNGAWVADN